MLKDSGQRREFESGAVRDMGAGKGRCDLMPLDVLSKLMTKRDDAYLDAVFYQHLNSFQSMGDVKYIYDLILILLTEFDEDTALLSVARQFELGAEKYSDNNWRKGIPSHVYLDSAIRHYIKLRANWSDEDHLGAVFWNLLCCIWTCENLPELNTYHN